MRPRSWFISWFAPAILLALGSVPAGAQIPHLLNYQGYLVDAASQPVNATVTMTFKLYGAAFGLGADDKTISTVDTTGVALAAIQGLHQLVREKDRELRRLQSKAAEVDALKRDLAAIKERLGIR